MNDTTPFAGLLKPDYIKEAVRTESVPKLDLSTNQVRMLHGAMGLCTEAGELLDSLKKHLFYGRELDTVNVAEEIGDAQYYMAILCDVLGISFEEIQAVNIKKLRARYPEGFSSERAYNRDLDTERQILEGTHVSQELPPL